MHKVQHRELDEGEKNPSKVPLLIQRFWKHSSYVGQQSKIVLTEEFQEKCGEKNNP